MTKTHTLLLVTAAAVSLVVGVVAGFFAGVASTKAGKTFLNNLLEEEQRADVSRPKTLARERFRLQYPSNWKIDVDDEDYDPDAMFSIESPGSAFVMFVIGSVEMKPDDNLQDMIERHGQLMRSAVIERFERYGHLSGKGALMRGRIMGIQMTVKLFAFSQDGLTAIITQQCPDEDLKQAQAGLTLIENSFTPIADNTKETPIHPAAGDVQ